VAFRALWDKDCNQLQKKCERDEDKSNLPAMLPKPRTVFGAVAEADTFFAESAGDASTCEEPKDGACKA
jgi:hypothetical protein